MREVEPTPPPSDRFHHLATLGSGANGVVFRALDLTLGAEVALKYLTQTASRDVYRFKREFRALAEVSHPNLVRLYELFMDGEEWSFSMELVAGQSLRDYLRANPGDMVRVFRQLTDGVMAIHALGKIHRDLKPGNVRIEPGGRVVILDFGLVRGLDPELLEHTHEDHAVGTPAFMSPEQARDEPLTAATDWYSVGVMLYEALTGRRPFDGTPLDVMRRRIREDAPPPRQVRPDVPAELDALCVALLHRDAAQRADGHAIFAVIGGAPSAATVALERQASAPPFVGRVAELAAMHRALDEAEAGACIFMPVIGMSGMGKSTLVRHFVDGLDEARVLVLEGRCHEREHVPYQGVESLVDAVATRLLTRPTAELQQALPADVSTLARLFPALLRVPAIASPLTRRFGSADPAELRRRAIAALAAVLVYLADQRTLVVVLDDLQWSDADGGTVLTELVRHFASGGALFVAASRGTVNAPSGRGRLPGAAPASAPASTTGDLGPQGVLVRELELGPLPPADVAALARAVAPAAGWVGEDTAALVRASGGLPFFVTELACHPGAAAARDDDTGDTALERLVNCRVGQLPADARALLTACAAAARPLPVEVAAVASGGDAAAALTVLRADRLLRTQRHGGQLLIEPYHDRIRAAVMAALAPEARRAVHRRLAAALEGRPDTSATELVEHFRAAGEPARAAHHARIAARQAEDALAFHVAADLYREAVAGTTGDDRRVLLRCLGACQANVGRLDAAIASLAEAAADATGAERRALDGLKIEYVLRKGDFERGVTEARALCDQLGVHIPRGPRATLVRIGLATARLRLRGMGYQLRDEAGINPAVLERIDVLWSLASGLSYVDPKFARLLQLHLLHDALACGERQRVARSLAVEPCYVGLAGTPVRPRIDAAVTRARAAASVVDRPEVTALLESAYGVSTALTGDWKLAEARCALAEQHLRAHYTGIRWVLNLTQFFRVLSVWYLGRTDELIRMVPTYLADAEAVGDAPALAGLRSGRGNPYWLVIDRPDEARSMAAAGMVGGGGRELRLHDWFPLLAEAQCDLYQGLAAAAVARLEAARSAYDRSLVKRIQIVRIEWHHVRARAGLALATVSQGKARTAALALARTSVRALAAEHAPWAGALEALCNAAIARLTGDEPAVVAALEQAIERATASDMALHAAVARYRLGETRSAEAQVVAATTWMKQRAIVYPAAMVRMIAPGWR